MRVDEFTAKTVDQRDTENIPRNISELVGRTRRSFDRSKESVQELLAK